MRQSRHRREAPTLYKLKRLTSKFMLESPTDLDAVAGSASRHLMTPCRLVSRRLRNGVASAKREAEVRSCWYLARSLSERSLSSSVPNTSSTCRACTTGGETGASTSSCSSSSSTISRSTFALLNSARTPADGITAATCCLPSAASSGLHGNSSASGAAVFSRNSKDRSWSKKPQFGRMTDRILLMLSKALRAVRRSSRIRYAATMVGLRDWPAWQ
mmetsp:Transcript_25314/g.67214  ORF Transcript_25314/g.67214 Transcript_25314/m.67214 type:complete len:216 (+) Transcript_25314:42-689(+)